MPGFISRCAYWLVIAGLLVVGIATIGPVGAQTQQQIDQCVNRGRVYPFDLAISSCTTAIQSGRWWGKDLSWAYNNRCDGYRLKRAYDRAIADCDEAIRLDPRQANAFSTRCATYHDKGDNDRAIADCDQAIRLDPRHAIALSIRCAAYYKKGAYDSAMADCDQAIRIEPSQAFALLHRDLISKAKGTLGINLPPPRITSLKPSPSPPKAASLGRRVALVIGNAAYLKWPRLENPGNDAVAVAAALEKQLGFDKVVLKRDLTAEDFAATLDDFAKVAAGADLGLIYFAGHGMEVSGANFLIPVDAKPSTAADLNLPGLPLEAVMRRLEGVRKLKLAILDACRDNPFGRGSGRGLKAIEPDGDTLVVYAAKAGTTAADDAGQGHSPFTQAFLKHLTRPDLDVRQLFGYVRDETLVLTRKAQQPWTYGTLGGDPIYLHAKQ